jgi:hypothetical protein
MNVEERVVVEGGEDEVAGIAAILAELVKGNLAADPDRARLLDGLSGDVAVTAGEGEDAVSTTLSFGEGRLRVRAGADPNAPVAVTGTFEAILDLSRVPVLCGLPRPFAPGTRALLGRMGRGEVRLRGAFRAPRRLLAVLRLVSVG